MEMEENITLADGTEVCRVKVNGIWYYDLSNVVPNNLDEVKRMLKEEGLSDFDKKLKQGLDWNPKDKKV